MTREIFQSLLFPTIALLTLSLFLIKYQKYCMSKPRPCRSIAVDEAALKARVSAWEYTDRMNDAMRCRPCPRTYEPVKTLKGNSMMVVTNHQRNLKVVLENK